MEPHFSDVPYLSLFQLPSEKTVFTASDLRPSKVVRCDQRVQRVLCTRRRAPGGPNSKKLVQTKLDSVI